MRHSRDSQSNFDELSKFYTVYAIDLLGFGRSSRVPFKGKLTVYFDAPTGDVIVEKIRLVNGQITIGPVINIPSIDVYHGGRKERHPRQNKSGETDP